jgi:hypothetical protein
MTVSAKKRGIALYELFATKAIILVVRQRVYKNEYGFMKI